MKTIIIYEDAQILVCYKPAGIAVQTAVSSQMDVYSELKNYLTEKYGKNNNYLGMVHRLDQPVCGLIVFAKTAEAAAGLSKQITDHTMKKIYRATVLGTLPQTQGTLTDFMYKDAKTNKSVIVSSDKTSNKAFKVQRAVLNYKELAVKTEDSISYTDVEIELVTGRHHQIRAQFSQIGCPLLGDTKYGNEESLSLSEKLDIKMVKLCAFKLSFQHPKSLKTMEFTVPQELRIES